MALRSRWQSRTLAVRDASRWAGAAAATAGWATFAAAARALEDSGVLMAGLLLHGRPEALGQDLAEHQQHFLTLRRGQAQPESGQRGRWRPGLRARGGTWGRRVSDMVTLLSARRVAPGATAPAVTAPP